MAKPNNKPSTPAAPVKAAVPAPAPVTATPAPAPATAPATPATATPVAQTKPETKATTNMGGPTHEQIARRAYEIYQARGGQDGRHHDDWVQAERELRLGKQ